MYGGVFFVENESLSYLPHWHHLHFILINKCIFSHFQLDFQSNQLCFISECVKNAGGFILIALIQIWSNVNIK